MTQAWLPVPAQLPKVIHTGKTSLRRSAMEIQKQQADQQQQPDSQADKQRAADSVAKPAAFRTFEEAITASGLLESKPPVQPGETGTSAYLVQPTQLLSWYPRHAYSLLSTHTLAARPATCHPQCHCKFCTSVVGVCITLSMLQPKHLTSWPSVGLVHAEAQSRCSSSARRSYLYPGFIDAERADHVVKMAKARLAPSGLALRKGDKAEDQK